MSSSVAKVKQMLSELTSSDFQNLCKQLVSRGSLKEGKYSTAEELLTVLTSSLGREEAYKVIDASLEEIGYMAKQQSTDPVISGTSSTSDPSGGSASTSTIASTSGTSSYFSFRRWFENPIYFEQHLDQLMSTLEKQLILQELRQRPGFSADFMSRGVLFRLMEDLEEAHILTFDEKTLIITSNRDIRSMAFHLNHLVHLKGPEASKKMLSCLRCIDPPLYGHYLVNQYQDMRVKMVGNIDIIINDLNVRGVPVSYDIKAIHSPHEKMSRVIDNLKSVEQKRIFYSILQEREPQTLNTILMTMETESCKQLEMVTEKWATEIATVAEDEWTKFQPLVSHDGYCTWYSFFCVPGKYECSVSGLRWTCKDSPLRFKYRFGQWWKHENRIEALQYMPAGPLLDITVMNGKFDEVHLPHWICTTVNPTILEKFAVVRLDSDGHAVEKVSEVTPSHVKLPHPVFSARGVLLWFCHWVGFPVSLKCKVLIYRTKKTFLTLHVYVIPSDPALEEELNKKGYQSIEKPYPEGTLEMDAKLNLKGVDGS
ncbi:uncharacterized protein LOC144025607 isoform X2 [Festucalex cinctus]